MLVIKEKAKYQPIKTAFCNSPTCCRKVQLTEDNRCMNCLQPVRLKELTYEATMDRFEIILSHNEKALNEHIFSEKEMDGLKIPIQIGTGNRDYFFVPLRYFIEYRNFRQSDDYIHDKKSIISFVEHIKKVSPKSKL